MNEAYPMPHADVPASQIFRAKDVRKSGMLRKKAGGFKFTLLQDPYDHRFVIIHNGWVYYYKNEKSEKQQGNFSLEGYSSNVVNAEEEEAKVQHVFKVYGKSAGTRIWYFAAENEMEKKEWMEAFRLEIERYKFAASTIKCSSSSPYPRSVETRTSVNERPKSVNISEGAFNQMHRSPLTNFPSTVTTDTGFSSMSSLLGPEDDYEPVNVYDDESDEFDTYSADEDYESPFANPPERNTTKFVYPVKALSSNTPPIPKRDPITKPLEAFQRSGSVAIAAELKHHRMSRGYLSSTAEYLFEESSADTDSKQFLSNERVVHNQRRLPPLPIKPSASHYLPMSGSSSNLAKQTVNSYQQQNSAPKDLRSPGLKLKPNPTSPHLSPGQKSIASNEASTSSRVIATKPMQRPFSDAFVSGRKFGQQKFTSEQANRHSADVTHMSSGPPLRELKRPSPFGASREAWERGQEFIRSRPPEPLPHRVLNLTQDISGPQLDDVPRRPPPTPPKDGHRDMNSQHVVGQSPKRLNESRRSNLPASPPFGFGVHKHNFDSSYAKNSAMPQFHLPPTISNQGKGGHQELQESPEYCEMDMSDEQPDLEVSLEKKTFNRYPIMPPMEEPSSNHDTGKSNPSPPHGKFKSPSAQHSDNLSSNSTQVHAEYGIQITDSTIGQSDVKATNSKPLLPKPVVPRKPNQLAGGNKGKPLPPAKPSYLQASHPPCGGVSVLRAAFESNQR